VNHFQQGILCFRLAAAGGILLSLFTAASIGGSICGAGNLRRARQRPRAIRYEKAIAMPDFADARMRVVRFRAQKPTS